MLQRDLQQRALISAMNTMDDKTLKQLPIGTGTQASRGLIFEWIEPDTRSFLTPPSRGFLTKTISQPTVPKPDLLQQTEDLADEKHITDTKDAYAQAQELQRLAAERLGAARMNVDNAYRSFSQAQSSEKMECGTELTGCYASASS